jgi:hypothetical protein
MDIQFIDVSNLPRPLAQNLAHMVQEQRQDLSKEPPCPAVPGGLSVIDSEILGPLGRKALYDRRVSRCGHPCVKDS